MSKDTPPKPPAAAIYLTLVLPGREPFQTGVDLSSPQWEEALDEIATGIRLSVLRFLLAEARGLSPHSPETPAAK